MSNSEINDLKLYQIPIDALAVNVAVCRKENDDFIIVDFNKAAEITEKIKRESIIGKQLCDVFPSIKDFGLFDVLERINKDGGHESFELKFYEDERISGWRKNEIIKLPNGDIMAMYEDLTKEKQLEEQLKQSEEQFRTISENSLMGIFIYKNKFLYANKALIDMSGYTNKELLNMKPWELTEESSKEQIKNRMLKRLSGKHFEHTYDDLIIITKDQQKRIARIMTQTIKYKDEYAGLGTVVDITDIKNTKQKLKILAQAVEQTNELVMITDAKGVIIYVNDAYVAHTGYKHHELIGKDPSILNSKVHDKEFFEELWQTISSGKTYINTITNRKKDKQLYYEEVTISPIYNDNGIIQNYISTGRDITPRIKMEEELLLRATTDNLTKIYNRYYGNEMLDVEVDRANRYGSSFAVIMFDIDYFKSVNDTYGHDVGDYVLEKLSEVVSIHMRKSDTFIRWGGEEFLIIIAHINKDEAMKFAHKLRVSIASYEFDSEINITISLGVTISKAGDTKESILKRADDALYKAKESGRNCTKFI